MSKKIYGVTVGTTMNPTKVLEKGGNFCGVRILAEGETIEDVPDNVGVIIDPNGGIDFDPSEAGMQFDGGYVDDKGFMHLTNDGEDVPNDVFKPFYVGLKTGGGITNITIKEV